MTRGVALDIAVQIATGVLADQSQDYLPADHEMLIERLGTLLRKLIDRDVLQSAADQLAGEAAELLRQWT